MKANQPGTRNGRREAERRKERDRLGVDAWSSGGLARSLQSGAEREFVEWADLSRWSGGDRCDPKRVRR
jgi:hypothetical protein